MERLEYRIKDTPRGFSYVEVTPHEIFSWGGLCICNGCNEQILNDTMYLSFVLADTYCKDCWKGILRRQEKFSQEDVDYDLALQDREHLRWYGYHLDASFRKSVMEGYEEECESTTDDIFS